MYHIVGYFESTTSSFIILVTNSNNTTSKIFKGENDDNWVSYLPPTVYTTDFVEDVNPENLSKWLSSMPELTLLHSCPTIDFLNSFLAEDHPELYI